MVSLVCVLCCLICRVVYVRSVTVLFVFKQKTAYEMRISDWRDVRSSDLHVRPALQILLRLTGAKTAQKLVRVELDADRVLGKCLGVKEGGRILDLVVIVDLQLDLVTVRIGIIHRRRRSVIDREDRPYALVTSAFVGRHQVGKSRVGEGDRKSGV